MVCREMMRVCKLIAREADAGVLSGGTGHDDEDQLLPASVRLLASVPPIISSSSSGRAISGQQVDADTQVTQFDLVPLAPCPSIVPSFLVLVVVVIPLALL